MLSRNDQHRVAQTLPRKRRTRRPEGKRHLMLSAQLDKLRDFRFVVAPDDHLRDLSVKTCIGTPSESSQLIGIYTFPGNELTDVIE